MTTHQNTQVLFLAFSMHLVGMLELKNLGWSCLNFQKLVKKLIDFSEKDKNKSSFFGFGLEYQTYTYSVLDIPILNEIFRLELIDFSKNKYIYFF